MIWIFNLERASAGVCDSYADLYQYICELNSQTDFQGSVQTSLHNKSADWLCEEDQKQWCIDFCQSNNYMIIETPSQPINTDNKPWNANIHPTFTGDHFKQAS